MDANADAGLADSPLARRSTVGALASVIFGAGLLQTLSEPLAAWHVPEQWPRAGVLSQATFVLLLTAGLALQSLGIVLARRNPTAGLVVAFGVYAILMFGLDTAAWLTSANMAVAVVMFFVALRSSPIGTAARLLAVVGVLAAMHWVWITRRSGAPPEIWWPYMLGTPLDFIPLVVAGTALGMLWGRQSRRVAAERLEAEAARREHELRIVRAREAERERIAQELHDVAAQHLAGLLSLADAAVDLAEDDPGTAVGLIADVRAEGRFAVASLYGALGELRSPDAAHAAPTPDAQQVTELVDRWRARGMSVEVLALGDLAALPAVVSVTAYRVVQEALANASKHAPGAAVRVRLLADVGRLSIVVENTAATRASGGPAVGIGLGWGLSGLRDRLTFLNGTLHAEPTADGGWRVSADLLLTQPETTGSGARWVP